MKHDGKNLQRGKPSDIYSGMKVNIKEKSERIASLSILSVNSRRAFLCTKHAMFGEVKRERRGMLQERSGRG